MTIEPDCPSPEYISPVQAALTHKPPTMALDDLQLVRQSPRPDRQLVRVESFPAASSSSQLIPVAPVLTSPATGTVTADTTPDFAWNSVPDGDEYEIQIDNLATFAAPIELTFTGLGTTYTAEPTPDRRSEILAGAGRQ